MGCANLKRGERMARNETYEEFVEKFKPKLTTDDCFTPEPIYDIVSDFIEKEYHIKRKDFLRPFYPGGDYENFDYSNGVVVDNPPFSIFSKIVRFYTEREIPFFLFAPYLTTFSALSKIKKIPTFLIANAVITYENGAKVKTNFVTNLEKENILFETVPDLTLAIKAAHKKENTRKKDRDAGERDYKSKDWIFFRKSNDKRAIDCAKG